MPQYLVIEKGQFTRVEGTVAGLKALLGEKRPSDVMDAAVKGQDRLAEILADRASPL